MPAYKNAKNGSWYVKFSYLTWDGKRKWLTKRGFSTKRDALAWENEFKLKTAGTLDMSLSSFINLYLSELEPRIKPDTMYEKRMIFSKWIIPYLGDKQINAIKNNDVIAWQNTLMTYKMDNGMRLSKSYLKTIHNQLSAVLNYAVRFYQLPVNPAATVGNMGTDREVKIGFWTLEEYKKFAEAEMSEPMFYYAYEVLYWAGLREGELLALTRNDIDFETKTISVSKTFYIMNGKEYVTSPKTANSNRIVNIPDFLCEELNDYLRMIYDSGEERLFPLTKSKLNKHIKSGAKRAGIHSIRVHDLRHSHVSLLISLGFSAFEIGKRVGHSGVYITYHYAHMFPNAQKTLANKLENVNQLSEDEDE